MQTIDFATLSLVRSYLAPLANLPKGAQQRLTQTEVAEINQTISRLEGLAARLGVLAEAARDRLQPEKP
jgi:hypothetical protein